MIRSRLLASHSITHKRRTTVDTIKTDLVQRIVCVVREWAGAVGTNNREKPLGLGIDPMWGRRSGQSDRFEFVAAIRVAGDDILRISTPGDSPMGWTLQRADRRSGGAAEVTANLTGDDILRRAQSGDPGFTLVG